ncbi:MAG TPA: hypothetical protein PLK12_17055, partial [Prolixibacteraceae bacterium]|nr:hypothetical protein [Prolixibacteraceae bacterium]
WFLSILGFPGINFLQACPLPQDLDQHRVATSPETQLAVDIDRIRMLLDSLRNESFATQTREEQNGLDSLMLLYDAEAADTVREAVAWGNELVLASLMDFPQSILLRLGQEAVSRFPSEPALLNNYATVLSDMGRNEPARMLLLEALKVEPGDPVILNNLANIAIDEGHFEAARTYASQALATWPDYGGAYQTLTTVHLKNGDKELAAETLVKSARNCWNELSVFQFESFLDYAANIPADDDFPLKKDFIDELYQTAKDDEMLSTLNLDDLPEAQIRIRPFPQLGDIDHMIKSVDALNEQLGRMANKNEESIVKAQPYYGACERYVHSSASLNEPGMYPTRRLVRQIYAFRALTAFYEHEGKKIKLDYTRRLEKCEKDHDRQKRRAERTYERKIKENDAREETLQQQLDLATGSEKIRELSKQISDITVENIAHLSEYQRKAKEIAKLYYNEFITINQQYYNEVKQLMEEYWLRSGGLIKYIYEDDCFYELQYGREHLVYASLYNSLSPLIEVPYRYGMDVVISEEFDKATGLPQKYKDGADGGGWGDVLPEMEEQELPMYPESTDFPEIGFTGKMVSVTYDGDKLKFSAETPVFVYRYILNFKDQQTEKIWAPGLKGEKVISSLYRDGTRSFKGFGSSAFKGFYVYKGFDGEIKDYGEATLTSVGVSGKYLQIETGGELSAEKYYSLKKGTTKYSRSIKYTFLIGVIEFD